MEDFDCLIVGGGPAGLTAALALGRSRRKVAVFDEGRPANLNVEHSHGYFTRDGESPAELRRLGREDLTAYDVTVFDTSVASAAFEGEGITLNTGQGRFTGRRLLIASGAKFSLPEIPGLQETWGIGSANCPYCHGWEWNDKRLAIIGADPDTVGHHTKLISNWSKSVTLFPNGVDVAATDLPANVTLVDEPVTRVVHTNGTVTAVVTGEVTHDIDAIFVAVMPTCNDTLLRQLDVEMNDGGWPVIDMLGKSSDPRVYVAGNATVPFGNILTSAASGFMAGSGVNVSLL